LSGQRLATTKNYGSKWSSGEIASTTHICKGSESRRKAAGPLRGTPPFIFVDTANIQFRRLRFPELKAATPTKRADGHRLAARISVRKTTTGSSILATARPTLWGSHKSDSDSDPPDGHLRECGKVFVHILESTGVGLVLSRAATAIITSVFSPRRALRPNPGRSEGVQC